MSALRFSGDREQESCALEKRGKGSVRGSQVALESMACGSQNPPRQPEG